jgi:hypothetical protein
MMLEQVAQACDHDTWQELKVPSPPCIDHGTCLGYAADGHHLQPSTNC